MNQDSSFPPMLPPSTELGALLFAVLPCLQETYRPLASFAYHMTELTRLKSIPSVPSIASLSGIDTLITDKDIMLRSLSFYGKMFRMPLLSTIATLLQGMQFYRAYKDILPGLFSGMNGTGGTSPDLFSMLGGLSPDLLSSLFPGFSGGSSSPAGENPSASAEADKQVGDSASSADTSVPATPDDDSVSSLGSTTPEPSPEPLPGSEPLPSNDQPKTSASDDTLYNTLFSFLTPEQQKIYDQLMHTD